VPDRTYVAKLVAGRHAGGTVYAAFDNHKNGDFKPYLLKSDDAGKTWSSIAGNLPERGTVYCLAEDHVNPDLLFCGTEFGLFVTWDGGKKWQKLPGLPTIQVKDLAVQRHNSDLVVGTFGRGIYVLDDYSALRNWRPELADKPAHLFAPREAVLFAPSQPLGGSGKGEQGAAYYAADNPPAGAPFLFHLKDKPQSLKQKREAIEAAARKEKKEPAYPKPEMLRAEAEEEAASVSLTIADDDGQVVRVLPGAAAAGFQRVTWDLRDAGGALVPPGTYTATLSRRVTGTAAVLAGPTPFRVIPDVLSPLTPTQHRKAAEFYKAVRKLQQSLSATTAVANDLLARLEAIRVATDQLPPGEEPVRVKARNLATAVKLTLRALNGDDFLESRQENAPVSVQDRVQYARSAARGAVHPPTGTQKQCKADAEKLLAAEAAKLRAVLETDVPPLEQALIDAGVPYTPPGKLPK
jgi:hypothetical protein